GDHQVSSRQGPHPADGLIWRITERRAFQSLASTGRRSRTESLWCSYVNDPAVTPVRVAFALGRNIGPATTRNRVRRRLRAILQAGAASVPACGYLLIGARP